MIEFWPPHLPTRILAVATILATCGAIMASQGAGEQDRARIAAVTAPTTDFSRAEPFEALSGGAATSRAGASPAAFSRPSATMGFEQRQDFRLGEALFDKLWVAAPSSTQASDGLGPLYNARSCQSCHVRAGRGRPPLPGAETVSTILRLARPARSEAEKTATVSGEMLNIPDDIYGAQLQTQAVAGLAAEGRLAVSYREQAVRMADGETVLLRKPVYAAEGLNYGPLNADMVLSARIAPQLSGVGLIETIAPADILALAEAQKRHGDGISGKPAFVRDHRSGEMLLGRFGWKAQNASVRGQSAMAFSYDLGISTSDAPNAFGDCTLGQAACLARQSGVQKHLGETEAPSPVLDFVTFYAKNLAVPARRNVGAPQVLRGKQMFYTAGCTACHTPKFVTRRDADNPENAFQLIWPYADFLLHDMGGGLADGQPVGTASGTEWRTPPLWGLGLTQAVNSNDFYLHDGRALSLTEAILWHGGEAQKARDAFAALQKSDRQALLAFLESL